MHTIYLSQNQTYFHTKTENPRLSSRGEHLHIDSGKVAYIKLDRNVLTTKNRSESPCQSTRSEQTYNDVRTVSLTTLIGNYVKQLSWSIWDLQHGLPVI